MNITPENIKNLLDSLFVSEYDNLVYEFNVILRQNDEGKTGIGVDVIMNKDMYDKYEVSYDIEGQIESQVRKILKYISPSFVMVDFYVIED